DDALSGLLKDVPVFGFSMDKSSGTRQLPVISNKVEGLQKDKAVYLKIENNEMAGFRIMKDDLALAYLTGEIEKDGVYLVEHSGHRMIRQIRTIEAGKLLLVSNMGGISTETVYRKDIKILAKLVRVEISL
ncbi:MAG: DNA-binding protein, partial [Clostridiales bacterium]|nr:DNA-binding protein [Clostridiales bacterium]